MQNSNSNSKKRKAAPENLGNGQDQNPAPRKKMRTPKPPETSTPGFFSSAFSFAQAHMPTIFSGSSQEEAPNQTIQTKAQNIVVRQEEAQNTPPPPYQFFNYQIAY